MYFFSPFPESSVQYIQPGIEVMQSFEPTRCLALEALPDGNCIYTQKNMAKNSPELQNGNYLLAKLSVEAGGCMAADAEKRLWRVSDNYFVCRRASHISFEGFG